MTWPNVLVFAVIMGVWTALMAMLVPDGNSFHDIAVTMEWWVLPAMFIIVNCKTPLDAALKTFVFFLISQPLVYLIQVPFSDMGWSLFGYYSYWFKVTLLTFPGAFIGWFVKKDKWYSGIILSVMAVLLVMTAAGYIRTFTETPPSHLVSIIYCLLSIPFYIFVIFKNKAPRICTAAVALVAFVIGMVAAHPAEFETNISTTFESTSFVGEPYVSSWSSSGGSGNAEIIKGDNGYQFKLSGNANAEYTFTVSDDVSEYKFKYYFDKNQQTVVVEQIAE